MSTLFGGGSHAVAKSATRAMGIDLQGAQYGAPIPVVFGQNKVAGNVIWYGDFKATGHQQKQPGKGGGGGSSSTSYTYSSSFELGLCEGPASIVNVYQGASTVSLSRSGGVGFSGTVGQAAWSHLSGLSALGYSGTSLAAFQNLQLGSSASLPNFNFEMAGRNQFGGGILDANPADILTAICSDTQIGVQFSALGDLTNFRAYCSAAGLLFSPVYATQNPAQQTLTDLFKYSNTACWFSEGVLKVQPYGDATITGNGVTYTPVNTAVADLGPNDFITNGPGDPVTIKRTAPSDAMNLVRVEYKDRANTYHTGAVVASIDQDVVGTGSRADQSESVDMITNGTTARLVAQNLLQRIYYIRNTYEFQLSWRYCYLEPMDIVTLTDGNTGLYLAPVRIIEVGEDEHGLLSIVAEEFPEGVSHGGTYGTQANAGTTVDPDHDPGAVDGPYLFRGPGFLVSNATPEIWCAVTGNDSLWAGCDVYLSHDGISYTYLNTTSRKAAYGHLTNTLPSSVDPDTTGAPNVVLNGDSQLLGGTATDADQFITLAMLDQEIISYQTATLAGGPSYTLGYLRRGGYGSAIAAHAVNAPFVRLDENILRIPVDPSQIGQTVYLKFVSFNAFGRGGRTLADETAYTYVIGTNIELPDVPITPSSFTATGVADGVSLTWINANPAAVGVTSIEYATATGGPWTVLAQVGPTNTSYAHHFTNGATFFYRARSRGPLVSAGWSAYTGTVTNTGTNVAAISAAANTATGQVAQLPVINGGFDIAPTGYGWTADAGTGWVTDTGSNSPGVQPNCARHIGGVGSSTGAYRNNGLAPCQPGQTYKTQALIKAAGANGSCGVYISWCDANGFELSTTPGNQIAGTTTNGSYAVGQAPSAAVFARTCLGYYSHTAGTYYVDNVVCTQYPSSVDEVPDGPTYARTQGFTLQNGVVVPFGNGDNLIPNHSFATNDSASPVGVARSVGQNLCDGWIVDQLDSAYLSATYESGDDLMLRLLQGVTVPASTTIFAVAKGARKIPVTASETLYAAVTMSRSYNQTYPASSSLTMLGGLQFYTSAGVFIGNIGASGDVTVVGSTVKYAVITVPSNAAYAIPIAYVSHTTGATAFNTSAGLYADCRIGDVQVVRQTGLERAGSGHRIGDQRNLNMRTVANIPASVPTTISYSYPSSSTSPVTVTISVAAWTLLAGSYSISYNAMSTSISLPNPSTTNVYLYFDDPTGAGGTRTLVATTNANDPYSSDGRVYVGGVSVTTTLSSSGSGGGGGGGACPDENAWVLRADPEGGRDDWCVRAKAVRAGHYLRLTDGRIGLVTYSERAASPRVRVTDENGESLTCSPTAPLELFAAGGECVLAPDSTGRRISARCDGFAFSSQVWKVEDAGDGYVQHITCQDSCYWTGDASHYLFGHHNKLIP